MPGDEKKDAAPPLDEDATRFLLELLDTPAPSGFEDPAAELWQRRAAELGAEVREDGIGTSFATWGSGAGPRIALVGHLDEIGLVVSSVNAKGFLKVEPIGGWDGVVLPG